MEVQRFILGRTLKADSQLTKSYIEVTGWTAINANIISGITTGVKNGTAK